MSSFNTLVNILRSEGTRSSFTTEANGNRENFNQFLTTISNSLAKLQADGSSDVTITSNDTMVAAYGLKVIVIHLCKFLYSKNLLLLSFHLFY